MKNQIRTLAILTYGFSKPLGHFSKGYIEDLPYKKIVLFGGLIPFLTLGTPRWKQKLIRYFISILAFNNPKKIEILKAKRLERILKKHKVDCCLAEFLNTAATVQPIVEKCNIPLISNVLGYEINDKRFYEKFKNQYATLSRYQSYTVPVAKDMIPKLIELGFEKENIIYSPIGPTEEFLEIQPNYESNQFIFIGRMTETKSPLNLIKAFKMVADIHNEAQMVMAGDGDLMTQVKELITELKLEQNIHIPGWISKEQQKNYYKNSFCYVQHSVTSSTGDKEGTPVSILEASGAGLPIVSTNHAGIPDVVFHEQTGFLVDENNVKKMGQYMIALYEDRVLAKQFGEKGSKVVRENFSLKRHLIIVESLINKAIENNVSYKLKN